MIQHVSQHHLQPEMQSVAQFCRVVEEYARQSHDPHLTARLCETQAERLRISRQEVSVETIDLLLDTLLNTLHHVAEGQGRIRGTLWKRLFAPAFRRNPRASQQAQNPPVRSSRFNAFPTGS